jgi:hypothetical protein
MRGRTAHSIGLTLPGFKPKIASQRKLPRIPQPMRTAAPQLAQIAWREIGFQQ